MPVQRRGGKIVCRIVVPQDVREEIGRGEVVKSLQGRNGAHPALAAARWESHVRTMFDEVRRKRSLSREQMDDRGSFGLPTG